MYGNAYRIFISPTSRPRLICIAHNRNQRAPALKLVRTIVCLCLSICYLHLRLLCVYKNCGMICEASFIICFVVFSLLVSNSNPFVGIDCMNYHSVNVVMMMQNCW